MAAVRAAGVDASGSTSSSPAQPTAVPDRLAGYVASLRPEARVARHRARCGRVGRRRLRRARSSRGGRGAGCRELHLWRARAGVVGALQACRVARAGHGDDPRGGGRGDARRRPTRSACRGPRRGRTGAAWPTTTGPTRTVRCASLLAAVRRRTLVPLVAAGGVAGPEDVVDLLQRGATLVQAGTAFLRCPESGVPAAAKEALLGDRRSTTTVTRAFSGRRARALLNAMVREHPDAPAGLPRDQQRHVPVRAAAARPGRRPHEPLRRHGLPRSPRRARWPRSSSG